MLSDLQRLASELKSRKLATGGPRPTQRAAMAVDFETEAFLRSFAQYVAATDVDLREAVEATAFTLEKKIKERTPKDTGRLRASFHTVLQGQPSGYSYKDNTGKTFDGTLSERPSEVPGVIEAIVGTNVDYALVNEAGNSRQAPNGMVRVSIAEVRGMMEREVERRARARRIL